MSVELGKRTEATAVNEGRLRSYVRLYALILPVDNWLVGSCQESEGSLEEFLNSYIHSGSLDPKKTDLKWARLNGEEKGVFARRACVVVAKELIKWARNASDQNIQTSLWETAREVLLEGAKATEEFKAVPVERGWLTDFISGFWRRDPRIEEKLPEFIFPPRKY